MSGYIEAGYSIVLGGLGIYGVTLLARERAARRRARILPEPQPPREEPGPGER